MAERDEAVSDAQKTPVDDAGQKKQAKDLEVGEYVESFSALKDSLAQGRDLRKRQKEFESYRAETQEQRDRHADQVNILANFDALVAEQEELVSQAQQAIDQARPELEKTNADIANAQGRLDEMKADHKAELAKLKAGLDARVSELEDAQASAKAARKEAQERYQATAKTKEGVGAGQSDHFKELFDAAKDREDKAGEALKSTKSAGKQEYRDKKQAFEADERPVSEQLSKLKGEARKLQDEIAQNKKALADANERIAYCRQVKENPSSVDELSDRIAERETSEKEMAELIERVGEKHQASKAASGKARVVVIVAAVLVVAIVIAAIVAFGR